MIIYVNGSIDIHEISRSGYLKQDKLRAEKIYKNKINAIRNFKN